MYHPTLQVVFEKLAIRHGNGVGERVADCGRDADPRSAAMAEGGSTEAQQAALKLCSEAETLRSQTKLLDDPSFRTPSVTLDPISNLRSIGLHTTNIRVSNGGLYTVNTEKPCYKLFREGGIDGIGRLSPTVKVTLGEEAKKAAGIPASATHFAFAYPLAFPAEAGEQIDAVLDEISAAISDPRVALLVLEP